MGSRRSKADSEASAEQSSLVPRKKPLVIEGYPVEGLSIGGQETCVIFPSLKLAFDIGRCPQRAISQEFLFITHGHMDHIVSSFQFSTYVQQANYCSRDLTLSQ